MYSNHFLRKIFFMIYPFVLKFFSSVLKYLILGSGVCFALRAVHKIIFTFAIGKAQTLENSIIKSTPSTVIKTPSQFFHSNINPEVKKRRCRITFKAPQQLFIDTSDTGTSTVPASKCSYHCNQLHTCEKLDFLSHWR